MRRLSIFLMLFCLQTLATKAQNDSIKTETLSEVVINADGQIETADKAVLLPTNLEKKHSTNGFDLLNVMQTPEFEVSPRTKSINTHNGGEVVLCINGMEVQFEDVATLRAKNIRSIEYIRTPSGKYAGKAGLLNFVTIKMEYGGNVYLSASHGFTYEEGDYLTFTDLTKKGLTLSLTASGDWANNHSYSNGKDNYIFYDHTSFTRDFTSEPSLRKSNEQAFRLKLTLTGKNHRFNSYVSLTRQAVPNEEKLTNANYTGHYENSTQRRTTSNSRNIAPTFYANYTYWLPQNQTLDFTASASFGHNKYNSHYNETGQTMMTSIVKENNNSIRGNARYYKNWKNGISLSGSLTHDHDQYKDDYMGTSASNQRLTNDVTMGLVQISGSNEKYFFYVSGGVSNSVVKLNDNYYNYCNPVAFYGGNYAINHKHSLSLNGLYTHTHFDPSNKNAMTISTSFFEAVKGNPDLAPLQVLGNTLSYNGQFGNSKITVSYNNNIYFDNILHLYNADKSTIYDTRINDGTFYGNMLSATYSYSGFSNKLRLSATSIEEYNTLRGNNYNISRNVFRIKTSITYIISDWMMRFNYRSSYTALDIREPYLIHHCSAYELQISWNHKDWAIETTIRNPFSRYEKQHITMDYGCYQRDTWNYDEPNGCNLNLKITYNMGYGKKAERSDTEINKKINSAIMKTY